jgi:hypothetical protein
MKKNLSSSILERRKRKDNFSKTHQMVSLVFYSQKYTFCQGSKTGRLATNHVRQLHT